MKPMHCDGQHDALSATLTYGKCKVLEYIRITAENTRKADHGRKTSHNL